MINATPPEANTAQPSQNSLFQRVIVNPLRNGLRNFISEEGHAAQTDPKISASPELAEHMKHLAGQSVGKQEQAEKKTIDSNNTAQKIPHETPHETEGKIQETPKQSFIDNLVHLLAASQQNPQQQQQQQQQHSPMPQLPDTQGIEALGQAITPNYQNNQIPLNYNYMQPQQNPYGQQSSFPFMPQTNFLMGNQQRMFGGGMNGAMPMMNNMNFGTGGLESGHNFVLPNYYQGFFSSPSNLKPLNLEHNNKNALDLGGMGGIGSMIGIGGLGGFGGGDLALGGSLGFGGFGLGGFLPPAYI